MRPGSDSHRHAAAEPIHADALPAQAASDFLPIRDYVRIVYRRRWLIAGVVLAGLLGAVAYNWLATPRYDARATIEIQPETNVLGVDRPVVDQRQWAREYFPTQLGILESRDLARRARALLLAAAGPAAAAEEQPSSPAADDDTPSGDAESDVPDRGAPSVPTVGQIIANRTIVLVKDSRLVRIVYRSSNPKRASAVANALAQAYVDQSIESRTEPTGEASEFLDRQVEEQRKLVQASEAALQRYRQAHGAEALFSDDRPGSERQNIVAQKLAELQGATTKARSETIDKEAQYRQLARLQQNGEPLDTLPAIASNAYIQGLQRELTELQRQMVQAAGELGELHPDMIKLRESVRDAEQRLQRETQNVARVIRNDYENAQARERALTAALERQKGEMQGLNAKMVEYTALEREANSNREGLDKLLQRSREARLAGQLQTTSVRIVDRAETPVEPVMPRAQRNILLSLVGSGALALVLVFLLEATNTRVTSPDDVRRHLHIRVLGVASEVMNGGDRGALMLGDGAPPQFTELMQGVRTNLVLAPELASTRTLLVTSTEPGEGKTMTAANIAVSLARLNQRVLLIDADLRKPRLHKLFALDQKPGLTDLLTGRATQAAFQATKVDRLWLVAAGDNPSNPTDLLGSQRFSQFVEYARNQFDWVILDSPPVLAVTDPCLIARAAAGVLFVVGSGQTSREAAAAAVERLESVGATVVGAVLNRVVLEGAGWSYLPYYHRDYQAHYPAQEMTPAAPDVVPDVVPADTAPAPVRADAPVVRPAGQSARSRRYSAVGEAVSDTRNPWDI